MSRVRIFPKSIKLLFFLLVLCYEFSSGFEISIDFRGATFDDITNVLNDFSLRDLKVKTIILDNPFKFDEGGFIYSYDVDPERIWVTNLGKMIEKDGIEVFYCIQPFVISRFFNRREWTISDFTLNSILYLSNYYLLDISSEKVKKKLKGLSSRLKEFGNNWVVDLTGIPKDELKNYLSFTTSIFEGKTLLITKQSYNTSAMGQNIICSENYWWLRENAFLPFVDSLSNLINYKKVNYVNFVEGDTLSINNLNAIFFLALKGEQILMPYKLFSDFVIDGLAFIKKKNPKKFFLEGGRMLFYSGGSLILINMNENFGFVSYKNFWGKKNGIAFPVIGSGFLEFDGDEVSLFILPESVAFFDLD